MSAYDEDRLRRLWQSSPLGEAELDVRDAVDSTNAVARRHAERGAVQGTLVIADQQLRGRGQHDRSWHSPPGVGLWMTLVLRPVVRPADRSLIPLAAGIGVSEGLERLHQVTIALKWPNDVMMDGRKLGGILVESVTRGDRLHWVLVGVGINLTTPPEAFPDDLRRSATSLWHLGPERVDRERTAVNVAVSVVSAIDRLAEDAGRIVEAFESRDALRDRRVRVDGGDGAPVEGVARGIDDSGALRLETASDSRAVRSGSVRVIDP